ncbi:uncharacterized protein AtWU_06229 [Aspergillus tubingensis]|uniref:uncharacterized protein n=1 Tax=Aspergillus tubingensis TaxID=5068 RepID=UPI0015794812|nr:uncharacterized protein AtWU_06229 [Aspergillus tubingensis]GFN16428.1 hypothetical protein AtWU_06229 [Aspergillus tubingensis]
MHPPMTSSREAQKTKNTPNGSASTHTTNARRKPLMDFSSLHPCSASMDDEEDEDEDSMQSSYAEMGSFVGVHSTEHSHSHSHPLSLSSSASTPTQTQRYTQYQPCKQPNSRSISLGSESTPTSTTTAITTRLKSKSKAKAKSTTAHVHFLDQIDISDTITTTSAATNTNTKGNKSTEANGITAEEKTMPLGPRSRDLSLSESEISLLDIGPSLVYGDDGYIPLSGVGSYVRGYERGHGHGQGDGGGGGVSVVGRGVQGLHLE